MIGAGLISIVTLFLSMIFPESLRRVSLAVMSLGPVLACAAFYINRKDGESGEKTRSGTCYFTLFIMVLPVLIGSYYVRMWGDELNMEGPLVRYWLQSGDFFMDPEAQISFYDYPRLWVIMLFQCVSWKGLFHETAGRWLTITFVLCSSLFVWKEYCQRWGSGKWTSLIWASFWMCLVFGPMFAWSVSWYYSIVIAMLVMMSFYYIIVARNYSKKGDLDFKLVTVSSIFMAMITGIRPDGFLYIPLLVVLIFVGPVRDFRSTFRKNLLATILVVMPASMVYFGWSLYANRISSHIDVHLLGAASRIEQLSSRFLPVTVKMFSKIITQWNQSGVWFACFLLCLILGIKLYKFLDSKEKRLLLLLTVPAYKFFLMIIESSLFFEEVKGRMGRHIMQTAPVLYFLLGFLFIKWIKIRFGHNIEQWTNRVRLTVFSSLLVGVFLLQLLIGSLFANLPSYMNDYMEDWAHLIKKEYPQYNRILVLISDTAPRTTRVTTTWRFYATATPDIYANLGIPSRLCEMMDNITNKSEYIKFLNDKEIKGVLVYGADDEISNIVGFNLARNRVYLLEVGKDDFKNILSKEIPYSDIWVVPWRKKAIKRLIHRIY